MAFNIVLVNPQIPPNTGNIVRTCAITGSALHLEKPLGFSIDDRYLKRAGLDYWLGVPVEIYEDFYELRSRFDNARFYYLSTKGKKAYHEVRFSDGDFLVFGSETQGLPKDILELAKSDVLRVPMLPEYRSLNLSNAVAIVVYEALRQLGFEKME